MASSDDRGPHVERLRPGTDFSRKSEGIGRNGAARGDGDSGSPGEPGLDVGGEARGRERARVLTLLRRHGYNATSFQVLGPAFRYWFDRASFDRAEGEPREDRACVAFVDTGKAWVAAGAPIAPEGHLAQVAQAFADDARRAKRRVCFFGVEARFSPPSFETMLIGEQPVWDPFDWPETCRGSRNLREQLRRARAKGVRVTEVTPAALRGDGALCRAIERLVDHWLETRPMAPMGFVVDVRPFVGYGERRCFVARGADGEVLAVLSVAPVFERRGWLVEHLLREPWAPNGTAELLIDALMQAAAADGCHYVTLGLAPLAGPVPRWLARARRWLRPLYHFEGLRAFKAKLRPARWDPIFLAYPRVGAVPRLWAVHDTLAAFAGSSFVRFGLRTAVHNPRLVLLPLAALLVPWTVLVALADASWFPAPWVRDAWVAFDAMVAPALFALGWRFRRWLAAILAVLVSADSVLTFVEAMAYNMPRTTGVGEAMLVAAAFAAPTITAALLWLEFARGESRRPDSRRPDSPSETVQRGPARMVRPGSS